MWFGRKEKKGSKLRKMFVAFHLDRNRKERKLKKREEGQEEK